MFKEEEARTPLRKIKIVARGMYAVYDDGKDKYWIPLAVDSSGKLRVVTT